MSDDDLRSALESLSNAVASTEGASGASSPHEVVVDTDDLRILLAAHPAESAPRLVDSSRHLAGGPNCPEPCSDHGGTTPAESAPVADGATANGPAVRAIAAEFMARYKGSAEPDEFALSAAEAGLLAALPHLAPVPVADRERVAEALRDVDVLDYASPPAEKSLASSERARVADALAAAGVFRSEAGQVGGYARTGGGSFSTSANPARDGAVALDREAVEDAIRPIESTGSSSRQRALVDAVMELARPEAVVKAEALREAAQVLRDHHTEYDAAAVLNEIAAEMVGECVCGKPIAHVDANPESSDWACRIPGAER